MNPFWLPVTQKEHEVCDQPQDCEICRTRCYEGLPGHNFAFFTASCDCGKYKNVPEYERTFLPIEL